MTTSVLVPNRCPRASVSDVGSVTGDIELSVYLVNVEGPTPFVSPLVLDLRITHDRFGSNSDPSINGTLHYPNDIDRSLNEASTDKIRKYHRPPPSISFMSSRLTVYTVNLFSFYFYRIIGKLTAFLKL